MVLETLAEPQQRPKIAQDLFDTWEKQINESTKNLQPNTEEFEALESIKKELLHRRVSSLRSQIYNLVLMTLKQIDDPNAVAMAKRAKKIYDSRSTLVHNGFIPDNELQEALTDVKQIVQKVLKIKFCLAVGKNIAGDEI